MLILPFSSSETTLARAGGKGSNLAALARAGFDVPPGFLVTTDAYRAFVESRQLQPRILSLATGAPPDDPVALEHASAQIRALFEQGEMPGAIAEAVVAAYRRLAPPAAPLPVAVRSSATAEDLPGLAFAGQQETYLNVVGEEAVKNAVLKCWGSLWTARAMAYRARNGIPPDEIALAVVVQQMIASESSGVLFTANPLTGRRDEIVVDASFGLGEAIVSGQVDPDHYVIDPHAWRISERRLGAKGIAIVPQAGGGTRQVTQDLAGRQALPDAEIVKLAQTAQRVADLFEAPQDIEWAYAEGKLYLLQARPITSLFPVPINPFPDPGLRVYFSLASVQGVTDPLTPLGANALQMLAANGIFRLLKLPGQGTSYVPKVGERLYIDMTDLARDPQLRHLMLGLFVRADAGALAAFRRLLAEGRIPLKKALTRRRMFHLLTRVGPIMPTVADALLRPEHARARAMTAFETMIPEETARIQSARDLAALTRLLRERLPQNFADLLRGAPPAMLPAIAGMSIVGRWLERWLGERPGLALELMRGLENNVTTEMDLALWAIAREIRADASTVDFLREKPLDLLAGLYQRGELPRTAQAGIGRFLDRYGMRAVGEIDMARPRWSDDPTPIISTLLGYLTLSDPDLAPDAVFARGRAHALDLARELVTRVQKTKHGWFRARVLSRAIRVIRTLGGLRELPKFTIVQVLYVYRTAFLAHARELVSRGQLERAEDIFFVPFDTLDRFAQGEPVDLKATVADRRAEHERERARRQIPRLMLSNGEAFYEGVQESAAGGTDLAGDPVSPGVAEGVAHVVLDPRGVRLAPGEILVCPATDPGWTPLFLTAGGLVMEIGGLVTHGSVVAREYGIPAVVGVHDATRRVASGQHIRVDGNTGRVTLLDPVAAGGS